MAPISEYLGNELLKNSAGEKISLDEFIKDASVVGLYFSAHWCPPCRGFTPKLAEIYNKLKETSNDFKVIFISCDRDEGSFKEYFGEMPWAALPFSSKDEKEKASEIFKIRGIPALILLKKDGTLITENGRNEANGGADGMRNFIAMNKS